MKTSNPVVLSHQNPPTYLFRTAFTFGHLCLICSYFSPDSDKTTFSMEKVILWLEHSHFSQNQKFEVKNVLIMDLFVTNTQLFALQDVNWWTGVTCGLLWCFYQLFGLILTAPIHCRGSIAEQVMECYISPHSSSFGMAWGWVHFPHIFIFGWKNLNF